MSDFKIKEATVVNEHAQPILTHEKSLSQKIARGSEAGDILDQQMIMLGIQLVTQLNVLIKTSRIYDRTNAALDKPVDTMLTLIKTMAHDRPVTLRLQDDFLFLGENHLKVTAQQMAVVTSFIDALNVWKIGGVSFSYTTESKELREFAALFVTLDPDNNSIDDLRKELTGRGVNGIELEEQREVHINEGAESGDNKGSGTAENKAPGDTGNADPNAQRKGNAKNGYAKVAGSVGTLTQSVRERGTVSFKQAKRAIQNIVDLMMDDEATVLGLTTLRCHDQYTHNHSVNVSLLSIALANRAGYPKAELADLGLAALFHDMGKSTIPIEVLNKPGEFTDDDWVAMRNHPTEGVLALSKLRGITNLPGRMAAASFEHHMNLDFSGYPKLTVPWTSLTHRSHPHDCRLLRRHDLLPCLSSGTHVAIKSVEHDVFQVWQGLRLGPAQAVRELRRHHSHRQLGDAGNGRAGGRGQTSVRQDERRTTVRQSHHRLTGGPSRSGARDRLDRKR